MSDAVPPPTPTGGARGNWDWTRMPRPSTGPVVTQIDEDGCGPACGEMLLV